MHSQTQIKPSLTLGVSKRRSKKSEDLNYSHVEASHPANIQYAYQMLGQNWSVSFSHQIA